MQTTLDRGRDLTGLRSAVGGAGHDDDDFIAWQANHGASVEDDRFLLWWGSILG